MGQVDNLCNTVAALGAGAEDRRGDGAAVRPTAEKPKQEQEPEQQQGGPGKEQEGGIGMIHPLTALRRAYDAAKKLSKGEKDQEQTQQQQQER